jgi:hypothetical protein
VQGLLAGFDGVGGEAEVEHGGDRLGRTGGGGVDDRRPVLVGQSLAQVTVISEQLLGRLPVGAEAGPDESVGVGAVIGGAGGLQPCCGIVPAGPDCQAQRRYAAFAAGMRLAPASRRAATIGREALAAAPAARRRCTRRLPAPASRACRSSDIAPGLSL